MPAIDSGSNSNSVGSEGGSDDDDDLSDDVSNDDDDVSNDDDDDGNDDDDDDDDDSEIYMDGVFPENFFDMVRKNTILCVFHHNASLKKVLSAFALHSYG